MTLASKGDREKLTLMTQSNYTEKTQNYTEKTQNYTEEKFSHSGVLCGSP